MTADDVLEGALLLVLEPDDVLVVEAPMHVSAFTADRIKQRIAEYLPGHRCMILDSGATLRAVRP